MLDISSEHSPTTKCPADSTEEVRTSTVNTTSAVKKSNNRDKIAVGYTRKEKQFESKDNTQETFQNSETLKTSPSYSQRSSIISSSSIYSTPSTPPNSYTLYIDSNLNHIKNKVNENLNHKELNPETGSSPRKGNNTFLSDRKQKSLAKLVASKQVDKNVNKFYHHREIKEDKGEENCLSTCQGNSSKIRNYKHSNNKNIEHQQCLEENHDIKILNSRTNINERAANNWSPTAENTSSQNKTSSLGQKKGQNENEITSVDKIGEVDVNEKDDIYPIIRYKSQKTYENSSVSFKEIKQYISMESDIKPILNLDEVCGNTRLMRPKAESLPPIESTAEESSTNKKILNKELNDKTDCNNSERKLSGKEKLLKFHDQDEFSVDDQSNTNGNEYTFGGVYIGGEIINENNESKNKDDAKNYKKTERQLSTDSMSSPTKSASETNLSRNHSLKYSGGALHVDRNPLSFDHTFPQLSQNTSHQQQQRKIN